ncbi:hypothetical protein OQJ13_07995 [Legionella sp. PATHC035]|uniref:hypothetical protein n=1 Tax=Legionella sp. PATHC035 TaxID=2992040 RepID=UPI0022436F9F|nr:hypothetical protein [Legionella sp. PATHC035]MCW8408911.1 hypothetical protein [Legionella sp. PATHC035]
MQKLIIRILYSFLVLTILTFLLTLSGIGYLWFYSKNTPDLPYLGWLLTICIGEIIALIIGFTQKGFKYLPEVHITKNEEETNKFMENFITSGSSATIFSNRASWLVENEKLLEALNKKIQSGINVEIITNKPLDEKAMKKLSNAVNFLNTQSSTCSRFTLINGTRNGSEKLAIAKGNYPEHEITIFDSTTGPQMIGLAKDIIKLVKGK